MEFPDSQDEPVTLTSPFYSSFPALGENNACRCAAGTHMPITQVFSKLPERPWKIKLKSTKTPVTRSPPITPHVPIPALTTAPKTSFFLLFSTCGATNVATYPEKTRQTRAGVA